MKKVKIITEAQKGTNQKRVYKPSNLIRANHEHKNITLSLSAICRYIDKLNTQNLLDQKGFKPNAIKLIKDAGAYRVVRHYLNEKEEEKLKDKKKFWSLYSLTCIVNRCEIDFKLYKSLDINTSEQLKQLIEAKKAKK